MWSAVFKFLFNLIGWGRGGDRRAGPIDWSRVQSVLVVRNDNIGDVVLSTPCLEVLRKRLPRTRIGVLVCGLTADVVRNNPFVDRIHVYHKAKHGFYKSRARALWEQYQVMRRVRRERYDLAIGLRAVFSPSQGWLVFCTGARWRLGRRAPERYHRLGFFYNVTLPEDASIKHEVERNFDVLRAAGLDTAGERLYVSVPKPVRAEVERELAGLGQRGDGRPRVGLYVSRWAYRDDRTWPDESYAALIRRLHADQRFRLVVCHAPDDKDMIGSILRLSGQRPPTFYSAQLIRFAAMTQACDLFITPEGGPMHLAAAGGTPLVVLWGRNLVSQWGPWGVEHEIVGAGGEVGSNVAEVGVDEVISAVDRLWGRVAPREKDTTP
jgi:heptosyltransferase-3